MSVNEEFEKHFHDTTPKQDSYTFKDVVEIGRIAYEAGQANRSRQVEAVIEAARELARNFDCTGHHPTESCCDACSVVDAIRALDGRKDNAM